MKKCLFAVIAMGIVLLSGCQEVDRKPVEAAVSELNYYAPRDDYTPLMIPQSNGTIQTIPSWTHYDAHYEVVYAYDGHTYRYDAAGPGYDGLHVGDTARFDLVHREPFEVIRLELPLNQPP